MICIHISILRKRKAQRSITCTSRNVHINMTYSIYLSGCHRVTSYVITIYRTVARQTPYSTSVFIVHVFTSKRDNRWLIATLQSRDSNSSLYIVLVRTLRLDYVEIIIMYQKNCCAQPFYVIKIVAKENPINVLTYYKNNSYA